MNSRHQLKYLWKCLLVVIVLCGIFPFTIYAQDETPPAEATAEPEPQDCAECHIDKVLAWETGAHAMSFNNEDFQAAWTENQDDSCLACHTTGFTAFNGEFTHASVTCEACHGLTPVNHPDDPYIAPVTVETCASCHVTTFREWEMSPHGEEDVACDSCHNPHPQRVRFDDNTTLCTNCHEEAATLGYAHTTHVEQQCTDCHWHHGTFDAEQHIATGNLSASGHDANVETLACIDCHEDQEDTEVMENVSGAEATQEPGSNQRLQIQVLEAEVNNAIALGENTSAVRLIQGLVVGIAIGGILVTIFLRLSPGRRIRRHPSDEEDT